LRVVGLTDMRMYKNINAVTVACHKDMLFLPLLLSPSGSGCERIVKRMAAAAPLLLSLATVANLSLGRDGEHCLGGTALAMRSSC
jgi:hypothetical protein